MNKLFSILLALQFFSIPFAFAQFDQTLVSKVVDIQELAMDGYENIDPTKLLKAAKILHDNPRIRSLRKLRNVSSSQPDFFNEKTLLDSAFNFTPINKKRKRRKIQKKIDTVSDHIKMGINDDDLLVEVIKDLQLGHSVTIPLVIGAKKLLQLHLEDAQQLVMSVFLEKETAALVSDTEKETISLQYQTKVSGNYKIEIKNQSYQQTLGTFLMIMY